MRAMRKRRRRRLVVGDESEGDCCSSDESDKKVGLTHRDRVCQELRDLQVFVIFVFVDLHVDTFVV